MGNVMATAAGVVQRTIERVKNALCNATHKATDVVWQYCKPIKEKLADLAREALMGAIKFSVNYPRLFKTILYTTASSLACLALCPVVLSAVLPMFGFTSGGIAAGSLAAAWHAVLGNVAAGSLFAILQSAAAGGYGVSIVVCTLVASGGVGGIVNSLLGSGSGDAFGGSLGGGRRRIGPGRASGRASGPASGHASGPASGPASGRASGLDDHAKQE